MTQCVITIQIITHCVIKVNGIRVTRFVTQGKGALAARRDKKQTVRFAAVCATIIKHSDERNLLWAYSKTANNFMTPSAN
jgi:hypothetical protein